MRIVRRKVKAMKLSLQWGINTLQQAYTANTLRGRQLRLILHVVYWSGCSCKLFQNHALLVILNSVVLDGCPSEDAKKIFPFNTCLTTLKFLFTMSNWIWKNNYCSIYGTNRNHYLLWCWRQYQKGRILLINMCHWENDITPEVLIRSPSSWYFLGIAWCHRPVV